MHFCTLRNIQTFCNVAAKKKTNIPAPSPEAPKKEPVPQAREAAKTAPVAPQAPDFFDNLPIKAVWIATALLAVLVFFVFREYLFHQKYYCFKDITCDSYNLSYPNLYNTASYMAKYGMPKWSFASGIGQSIFPFFLRDPFDILLYWGGKNNIYGGLGYLEALKILLGGVVFFQFLKQLKISDFAAITGCMVFAFCGFMTEGSGWYIFTFEGLTFALLLLAFELLYNKNSWYLFPLPIFLIGISMPFNLYVYGLFVAIYAVFRHIWDGKADAKSLCLIFAKMLGLGVIGLMVAGPFLLENILQLLESPRGSGNSSLAHTLMATPMFSFPDRMEFGTGMMRLFSNDMLHSGDNFRGWQNILEAPMYYCGISTLVLAPQVFKFLTKKNRIAYGVLLALWMLPMFFPYFRRAFWLFTGDYYRACSFFFSVVLMLFSLFALDFIARERKINLPVLLVTVLGLLMLLNYPFFDDPDSVNKAAKAFASILLLVYGGVAFMLSRPTGPVNFKYIYVVVLFLELCYTGGTTINDREALTPDEAADRIGYNDHTVDAMGFIHKSDPGFYRVDKAYMSGISRFGTLNDGMVQDYNGTSSYNPFNQLYFIKYMQLFDVCHKGNEIESRWASGLAGRPILECENSVKYMLGKGNNINPFWRAMCDSVAMFGDVKVFRNKFALPLGYTYRTFIRESAFTKLNGIQKELVGLKAVVLSDDDTKSAAGLNEFKLQDTISIYVFNPDTLRNWVGGLKEDSLAITHFDDNHISGKVAANNDELMLFTVPYDGGWNVTVDGAPVEKLILNGGLTGIALKKGNHNIDMAFALRLYNKGLVLSGLGLLIFMVPAALAFSKRKRSLKEPEAEV